MGDAKVGESGEDDAITVVERQDAQGGEDIGDLGPELVGRGEKTVGNISDEIRVGEDLFEADLWIVSSISVAVV